MNDLVNNLGVYSNMSKHEMEQAAGRQGVSTEGGMLLHAPVGDMTRVAMSL